MELLCDGRLPLMSSPCNYCWLYQRKTGFGPVHSSVRRWIIVYLSERYSECVTISSWRLSLHRWYALLVSVHSYVSVTTRICSDNSAAIVSNFLFAFTTDAMIYGGINRYQSLELCHVDSSANWRYTVLVRPTNPKNTKLSLRLLHMAKQR